MYLGKGESRGARRQLWHGSSGGEARQDQSEVRRRARRRWGCGPSSVGEVEEDQSISLEKQVSRRSSLVNGFVKCRVSTSEGSGKYVFGFGLVWLVLFFVEKRCD
jgi:hypothetical protein